jgi:hypothetical protein
MSRATSVISICFCDISTNVGHLLMRLCNTFIRNFSHSTFIKPSNFIEFSDPTLFCVNNSQIL